MAGLMHTLGMGSNSLLASRQGLDTTAHNIANAHTEGFSRQRVNLTARQQTVKSGVLSGNGAYVSNVRRYHDRFLEEQRNEANSNFGEGEARKSAMLNLETIYSPELGNSIAEEMSRFFDSLQSMSAMPEDISLRINVREKGENLASSFRNVDRRLVGYRENLNDQVVTLAEDLTKVTKTIASLNQKILQSEIGNMQKANDLRDQRDNMIRELSSHMDINYYEDGDGMITIRGPGEALLVDRVGAAEISIKRNQENQGMYDIMVTDFRGGYATNITHKAKSGKLAGIVDIRDNIVKDLWVRNNQMASRFVNSFNQVHRDGFGISSFKNTSGRNFFRPVDDPNEAAEKMYLDNVVVSSVESISASSTANSIGDNLNLNSLLKLKNEKLLDEGHSSFNEFYSNTVASVGLETERSSNLYDATRVVLSDIDGRVESVSGVSLDEEATEMLRWQTAFTASSKIITTIDEMLETLLNLKR